MAGAMVSGVILKVLGSISTNTGVNPFCKTDEISETHVSVGTITSPGPYRCFIAAIVNGNSDDERSDDAQLLLDTLDIFEGGKNVSQKDKPYFLHFWEEVRTKKNFKKNNNV